MVDSQLPPAVNKLPQKQTEFKDAGAKGQYVNVVLQISQAAMTLADERWA